MFIGKKKKKKISPCVVTLTAIYQKHKGYLLSFPIRLTGAEKLTFTAHTSCTFLTLTALHCFGNVSVTTTQTLFIIMFAHVFIFNLIFFNASALLFSHPYAYIQCYGAVSLKTKSTVNIFQIFHGSLNIFRLSCNQNTEHIFDIKMFGWHLVHSLFFNSYCAHLWMLTSFSNEHCPSISGNESRIAWGKILSQIPQSSVSFQIKGLS